MTPKWLGVIIYAEEKFLIIPCFIGVDPVSYFSLNGNYYYLMKNKQLGDCDMVKKYWKIGLLVIVLLGVFGLMVTNWSPKSKSSQKPIRVVTSLNFYGEVAKAVAGDHGQVTSFINNEAVDPHDFQPSTKEAQKVSKANVVIVNGLGYDNWLSKLTKAADTSQKVINVGTQVADKEDGDNEHVWYQPATMDKLATQLAQQFSKLDPKHKDDYYKNAKAYQAKLTKLDEVIQTAKNNVGDQKLVDVSEPVFDYALTNLGYEVNNKHFEKAVEDDNDPSPQDIQQIRDDITQHKIAFFVNNIQESDKTVKNLVKLAKENTVPVLNVTETEPNGKSYVEWMTDQYEQLIKIQGSESSSHS